MKSQFVILRKSNLFEGQGGGSRDMHGLMDFTGMPEQLAKYVGNYPVHVRGEEV